MGMVSVDRRNGFAVISINRPPVNAMSLELWSDLLDALEEVEGDESFRGAIFASGLKKNVFTAGIDLRELTREKTDEERLTKFWVTLTTFLAKVYRSRLFTIAAVKGQCPAGGCALALCCDYRILTSDGSIGLNETRIGIPVPTNWARLFCEIAGKGKGESLLLTGEMLRADRARELGLVHDIVSTQEGGCVLSRAQDVMSKILQTSYGIGIGGELTKSALRQSFSLRWESEAYDEARRTWEITGDPTVRKTIQAYAQKLSKM
ncbi:hypothetical protein NDN08_005981 [Rhodosorus marinus]|uniref:3-hydroxyisobutyryl-CoA hydrolase n=1 Tax=Rhodosorus marinus TaxID=101924 RepID=A0AAV8UJI9_9RHOD|nr:hypothetical protein NDN08_005981 [Rhodosorus marinus]